jgi:nitroreductase
MMSEFSELATARYSLRAYSGQAVEQEKIDQLLEMVRVAPTACNNQPQRLLVVTDPDGLAGIDKATPCRFGAPLVFVVCYDSNECWRRSFDGEISGVVDASIVTTHLMLQAADIGLGTVWVMHFDPAVIREHFQLPEEVIPVALLPVGYPAPDAEPGPRHSEFKPLEGLLF